MYYLDFESHGHKWEKQNLVTLTEPRSGKCYDAYACEQCGIKGKSYQFGRIVVAETYSQEKVNKCEKMPEYKVPLRIKITRFTGHGKVFGNMLIDSVHEVVPAPVGYVNDYTGVWVMGVGEPVRVLPYEFSVVE